MGQPRALPGLFALPCQDRLLRDIATYPRRTRSELDPVLRVACVSWRSGCCLGHRAPQVRGFLRSRPGVIPGRPGASLLKSARLQVVSRPVLEDQTWGETCIFLDVLIWRFPDPAAVKHLQVLKDRRSGQSTAINSHLRRLRRSKISRRSAHRSTCPTWSPIDSGTAPGCTGWIALGEVGPWLCCLPH